MDFTTIFASFTVGLLVGLLCSYRNHYYAMIREEWNAGIRIRGLLNALLEKHRYSCKRGDTGPLEFFRFANRDRADTKFVDELDTAMNEFEDFLSPDDQSAFHQHWIDVRYKIRTLEGNTRLAAVNASKQDELLQGFNWIIDPLQELKEYTLKIRRQPWYRASMPFIPRRW